MRSGFAHMCITKCYSIESQFRYESEMSICQVWELNPDCPCRLAVLWPTPPASMKQRVAARSGRNGNQCTLLHKGCQFYECLTIFQDRSRVRELYSLGLVSHNWYTHSDSGTSQRSGTWTKVGLPCLFPKRGTTGGGGGGGGDFTFAGHLREIIN